MTQTENSSTAQLLSIRAKAISIGVLGPFAEAASKVAQIIGLKFGSHLSENDRCAIELYYKSKVGINDILIPPSEEKIIPKAAANDKEFKKAA